MIQAALLALVTSVAAPAADDWVCVATEDGRNWECGQGANAPTTVRPVSPPPLRLQPVPTPVNGFPASAAERTIPGTALPPLTPIGGTAASRPMILAPANAPAAAARPGGPKITNGYTLRIASVSTAAAVRSFAESFDVDPNKAYRAILNEGGATRHLLTFGRYDSPAAALAAVSELPAVIQTLGPTVLAVDDLTGGLRLLDDQRIVAAEVTTPSGLDAPDPHPGPGPAVAAIPEKTSTTVKTASTAPPPAALSQTRRETSAEARITRVETPGDDSPSTIEAVSSTTAPLPDRQPSAAEARTRTPQTPSGRPAPDAAVAPEAAGESAEPASPGFTASRGAFSLDDPRHARDTSGQATSAEPAAAAVSASLPSTDHGAPPDPLPAPDAATWQSADAFARETGTYTIQLSNLPDEAAVAAFVRRHDLAGDTTYALSAPAGRTLLVLGRFASLDAAEAALAQLPTSLRGPWIRRAAPLLRP